MNLINPSWPQDPRNFGLAYRLDADFAEASASLAALVETERRVVAEAAPRVAEEERVYPGPVVCCRCWLLIRAARAGYEKKPASHGFHPACADEWRRENGLEVARG